MERLTGFIIVFILAVLVAAASLGMLIALGLYMGLFDFPGAVAILILAFGVIEGSRFVDFAEEDNL